MWLDYVKLLKQMEILVRAKMKWSFWFLSDKNLILSEFKKGLFSYGILILRRRSKQTFWYFAFGILVVFLFSAVLMYLQVKLVTENDYVVDFILFFLGQPSLKLNRFIY